jgi:membrane protein required for colicin V production
MSNLIDNIFGVLNLFDLFFFLILIYFIIQCFLKGFSLSLISFMKWIVSTVITIILVPKFQPVVSNYIESKFINNVGLGAAIFFFSLFLTILIGKSLGKAITWTGAGSIDRSFGLLFGFFKGYIVSVCLFSILNWFYPYQNWGISAEKAVTFNLINKGSEILIEEFPSSEDFINTKEKIEKI